MSFLVSTASDQQLEIDAEKVEITGNGELIFRNKDGTFIRAFAPGIWMDCLDSAFVEDDPE